MAETFKEKLERWTKLVTAARAFVIALVALVAALAALVSGIAYLNKLVQEINVTRDQARAGVVLLGQDINTLQKTAQQNHDDIVKLNDYLLSLSETQVDAALSGSPPPVPPPIAAPSRPVDARTDLAAPVGPPTTYATPPAPAASQEPPKSKKAPPAPGPKPEPVDGAKAAEVFKK